MIKRCYKLIGAIKKCILIGIIITLFCEISTLRRILLIILTYLLNMINFTRTSEIIMCLSKNRICFERLIFYFICLCLFILSVLALIRHCLERVVRKPKGESAFEISLLRYLNTPDTNRCYLITGKWGVGKTFMLRKFIDKYYSKSAMQVYSISCVGLSDRNGIIDEINNAIKKADKTTFAEIIELVSGLPIVGGLLERLLKKEYEYGKVKKNSIFVFDDLERISFMPNHTNNNKMTYLGPNIFGKSEFNRLEQGLERISDNLDFVGESISSNTSYEMINKYLPVTGIINEMIDRYNYKVIIVCNTDVLGERYTTEIIRNKLNCIEYRQNTTNESISQLCCAIAERYESDDIRKQEVIRQYLYGLDIGALKNSLNETNLRLYANIFEAFVITTDLFDGIELEEKFLDSIFASILVIHHTLKNKRIGALKNGNVGKCIRLVTGSNYSYLPYSKERWIGYPIAGFYFMNLTAPDNVHEVFSEWKNYRFIDVEKKLANDDFDLSNEDDFELEHLCYAVNQIYSRIGPEKDSYDFKSRLDSILAKKDMYDQDVQQDVLVTISNNLEIYDRRIVKDIVEAMSKTSKAGNVCRCLGNSGFATAYNDYLDEKHNEE